MVSFDGQVVAADEEVLFTIIPGRSEKAYTGFPQSSMAAVVDDPEALSTDVIAIDTILDTGTKSSHTSAEYDGEVSDKMGHSFDWFEKFHVLPREISLGNILSTQLVDLEVYSAFRREYKSWISFINNAGAGVTLLGAPTLPKVYPPQSGDMMQVEVSTSGPASVDTTLDFLFEDSMLISVPIDFDRIVLFSMPPELPYDEFLEFLTDILEHIEGSEQRIALRKNPRQFFAWNLMLIEGSELARVENILFDWQSRAFGIPQWHEATRLTSPASIGATTITVQSTSFADYRVGGLALLYTDQTTFDVLTVDSLTSTTITFSSPTIGAYAANTLVMPLRTGVVDGAIPGQRWPVGAFGNSIRFRILDNDANLADVSAFSSLNGKVLFDDINVIDGVLSESSERKVFILDNSTGKSFENSPWDRSKRVSAKTFLCNGRQALWNVRKALHALRGQQVSFYLPTFAKDIELADPITNGSNTLSIINIGFTQYVRQRQPKNIIRIVPVSGSPITRTITNSSVVSATKESLTLSATISPGLSIAQVSRIYYIEKVRFASDRIHIRHMKGDRFTKVSAPVKTVFE